MHTARQVEKSVVVDNHKDVGTNSEESDECQGKRDKADGQDEDDVDNDTRKEGRNDQEERKHIRDSREVDADKGRTVRNLDEDEEGEKQK